MATNRRRPTALETTCNRHGGVRPGAGRKKGPPKKFIGAQVPLAYAEKLERDAKKAKVSLGEMLRRRLGVTL